MSFTKAFSCRSIWRWSFRCLLFPILIVVAQVEDSAAARLTYIFDASGSMWGQIDGVAKITIAKNALSELVQQIPDQTQVSLVAYGHRRKGDCADIEELVPMGPLDREAIVSAVQGINPKGKTPMADSLRRVAETLGNGGDDASIILISDGKETCNADPCARVRDLKQMGIDFTLHVIGFAVGGETEQQLRCMADVGGGSYFSADDASSFRAAARTALDRTAKNLAVSATRNGKTIAVDVVVSAAGTQEAVARRASTEQDAASFGLPPGRYDIRVIDAWGQEDKPEQTIRDVEVVKGETRAVEATFGGGALAVWAYRNGKPFAADATVLDAAGKALSKQTFPDRPARFQLPGGIYRVTVKDEWGSGAVLELGSVEVRSGETKLEAAFDLGALEVWAYRKGKPYVADVYILNTAGETVENMATREDQPVRFELLPGSYTVRIKDEWGDGSSRESPLRVEGGKDTEWKVNLDTPPAP